MYIREECRSAEAHASEIASKVGYDEVYFVFGRQNLKYTPEHLKHEAADDIQDIICVCTTEWTGTDRAVFHVFSTRHKALLRKHAKNILNLQQVESSCFVRIH